MKEPLSVIAGLLFVIAFVPYILAIVRKTARPAKASWISWATLDTITLAGMFAKDTLNGQIIGAVAGAWIVAILSMRFGTPGWTKLDKFCLAGAVLGIALWAIFKNPVLGIITSLCVVFIGSIPTFVSAWKNPKNENRIAWTIFWISCVAAFFGIPKWTLADASQPITFLSIETIMMFLLYVPRSTKN
jgi:hypothetical protein